MYYCPRCKAKVPSEALYCTRCGFNATNARLKVLPHPASRPNGREQSQPGMRMPQVQPSMPPTAPPAFPPVRSIQPETRRVIHPQNTSTPFTAATPMTPFSPVTSNMAQPINATLPLLPPPMPQIPETPVIAIKTRTNPAIPTRPLPSHIQQPTQTHITPAHLTAIQQSPSAPTTPPTLPTPTPLPSPQTQWGKQEVKNVSMQGAWNNVSASHVHPVKPQQTQQQPTEPPRPVTSSTSRSIESFVATRNAAERWRTSWRNKQRSEAGPATEVSRGQSSVPEPLMAMQHSLIRIRAIMKPPQKKKRISVYGVSLVLLACLIIGLSSFILSTYTGNNATGNTVYKAPIFLPPSLSVEGSQAVTIQADQLLHIHGTHFAVGDPIIFLLDGANSISGTDGREIALQVSNSGTFDVAIPVATSWSQGPHVIEAEDNKTGQTAYLSIQIGSTTLTSVNSVHGLALSQSHLNFQAYFGQSNPKEQFITLTNSSHAPIPWTAKAVTDNSLNWLVVDPTTTGGIINAGSTAHVGIETIIKSLKSNVPPYTGDILLSINGQEQLIVPVTMAVQDSAEWIFSPNPVTAVLSSQGGTCKPDTTLTLINLSNVPVFWRILTSNVATNHIQFMLNGKPDMQGVLSPTGQDNDMLVLTLSCTSVQIGANYPFEIDANNIPWNSVVLIQAS